MTLARDLDTPAVLIDIPTMLRNIERMQSYCDRHGINFRPHIKTHKSPEIARIQREAGAVGIACQKLGEVEVFLDAGFDDIQLPFNIVGPHKTARLAALSQRGRITVSADHGDVLDGLEAAAADAGVRIRVMPDLETEIERTGASPEQVVALARRIVASPHLEFAGLFLYPALPVIRPRLQETLKRLGDAGIEVPEVSGGGTGASTTAHEVPELTEIRVGTYIFNDMNTVNGGWATLDDCAMSVLATVVSRPTADRAILDSGSKTLAADRVNDGHGHIREYPDARVYKLNEEHGFVDLSACERKPRIGEQVRIVPVHTCVVSNLHFQLHGVRDGVVEQEWPVAARGLVR
ncbi:MAG: alanine racemase [Anaerolineaceae bacterium]|nr:alanine racemase [Anaerolineaceae bacterium]